MIDLRVFNYNGISINFWLISCPKFDSDVVLDTLITYHNKFFDYFDECNINVDIGNRNDVNDVVFLNQQNCVNVDILSFVRDAIINHISWINQDSTIVYLWFP